MATGTKAVDKFLAVTEENHQQPPTDVTVVVGKETFECHKSVLDSWSQYFRAVFTSPMSEQKANKVRIEEGDYVTAESFKLVLTYMYSGKIDVSETNLIGILRTSHYLQMIQVVELCKEFIDENNAVSISRKVLVHIAEMDFPDLHDVQSSATNHLSRHLYEYIINEEFMDLNQVLLQRILEKEELGAWDEDQIFVAVLEWLLKDEDRYQYGDSLLSKVRLGCVSVAKLGLVRQHGGLLPHLTTVEPIIMDMIVNSLLDENDKTPCKEKYPEMFRKRRYLAPEHLERLVPVLLPPDGDAYYWDKGRWAPGKLDLKDCISNITLGNRALYMISKSCCLMSRSLHSRKWTLVSRLPEMTSAQNPGGWSNHFLVCLGSYVYILSTGMSMQYDVNKKTWCAFDTELTQWEYINQAAGCYSTADPQTQVIVIAGLRSFEDEELCPCIAIGDPQNGWTEMTAKWADNYGMYAQSQIVVYSDTIHLTVSEEDNTLLALTNGPAVYSLSLSDFPQGAGNPLENTGNPPDNAGNPPDNMGNPPDNTGNQPHGNGNPPDTGLPEWQKVPTKKICGVSLVTWNNKKYSIFENILMPFPSKTELPSVEDLRYNTEFAGCRGRPNMQGVRQDWWRSRLMSLPEGFINKV